MGKVIQVVVYKSVSDEKKLAKYAELALPAMEAAGGRFLARSIPVAVKEAGEFTRTVVIEWDSLETAQNAYDGDAYQKALEALDGGAIREFRYLEAMSQQFWHIADLEARIYVQAVWFVVGWVGAGWVSGHGTIFNQWNLYRVWLGDSV